MPDVAFAYGKGSVTLKVPEGAAAHASILSGRSPDPAPAGELLRGALASARLPAADPVALVVPDRTRPFPHAAAFEALAPSLAGRKVEVVVGAGLHPGETIPAPWPLRVHDADGEATDDLGTAEGLPVRLDRGVARAGTMIVAGAVMPHYLAGFSGGPKGLVPGVAARATILAVHRLADASRNGVIEGNPFARAIRSCAGLLPAPALSLNLCVGPRGPFAATFGPLEEAHARAVALHRDACALPLPAPADLVVADAGGHPVDRTLLQAHKAYEAAFALAREGGTILLVARCDGGFGHPEFRRRLLARDPLAGEFHPYARTAAEWRRKAASRRTLMITEMDAEGLGVSRIPVAEAEREIARASSVLCARAAQDLLFR